jgi:hypothetical protein
VNWTVLLVLPVAFFTETNRVDLVAVAAMVKVALIAVPPVPIGVTDVIEMPPPVTCIGMAESPVRFAPVRVTLILVPAFPTDGLIPLSEGDEPLPPPPPPDGGFTMKVRALVVPLDIETLTLCAPVVAVEETVNVAEICVLPVTDTPDAVTPDPAMLIVAGDKKFVPVSVTGLDVLNPADDGEIKVKVGVGCATVKFTVPLVPLFVCTLML